MEFHISRLARDNYHFNDAMFSFDGNIIFANARAVHEFTRQMNDRIDLSVFPEKAVRASHIYAMGLIDEILHFLFQKYRDSVNPVVLDALYKDVEAALTADSLTNVLRRFCEEFPPTEVYSGKVTVDNYLDGLTEGRSNRQIVLEEILMLWQSNNNPAFMQYGELFDDTSLAHSSVYPQLIQAARAFFKGQPVFGPDKTDLLDMFHKPVEASPYSLTGQLEYIRNKWGYLLGSLLTRLLGGLDLIKEEEKAVFAGPGPAQIPDYRTISHLVDLESERFSPDRDWMPSLVLMAKNSYVWLDQLSKKYLRTITMLHEIPDEELDFLANSGFTGLWLIGLWQRSKASEQIKKLCGNPEAVASAYSIDSYRIADDLGGEGSFQNLRERAWQRGIRMASDMVPNHMGIDSDWSLHHPEYFLSLDHSPFPSYSFNGPNLSPDPGVGIHLEDHYYSRSDASVVFKRTDYYSGEEKYIYHGNDGTVMPWNDTAQLNYLLPEVREAVIQIILDVARRTPIIRFDAAMTLAKKHIQRLWFPEPGSGGAIPTRSERGLSKADFDRLMPEEFWREVVDRVARDVPDTLLLAEAFWLMEGYFVRTLGMHRVYNSAFMHMLRNEDNANFKTLIKNTLEFDPDILKRYVNFMNNPDEKTAVDQFGSGDKYFGVCTVLSTLPGLPMFGHGQLEGFTEKYGMEYRRAYLDEKVDQGLLNHHHKVIFPLLRKRACFSGAADFRLYDFYKSDGSVDENVFAYTNNGCNERSLVLYNNKFSDTNGWIKKASPSLVKEGGKKELKTDELANALGLLNQPDRFLIFKELNSGLMYIRDSVEVYRQGLYFELHAYQYQVYGDFFEVKEEPGTHFRELCQQLAGRGVPDIFLEMRRMQLHPLLNALKSLMTPGILNEVHGMITQYRSGMVKDFIQRYSSDLDNLSDAFHRIEPDFDHEPLFSNNLEKNITIMGKLSAIYKHGFGAYDSYTKEIYRTTLDGHWINECLPALWLWTIIRSLALSANPADDSLIARFYHDWMLNDFSTTLPDIQSNVERLNKTLRILMLQKSDLRILSCSPVEYFRSILQNPDIHYSLGINRANEILWFNQESLEEWLTIQLFLLTSWIADEPDWDENKKLEETIRAYQKLQTIASKIPGSEFKVDKLIELLR